MACDDNRQKCLYPNFSRQGYQDTQIVEGSVLTTDSYLEEAELTTEKNFFRGCLCKWKMVRRRHV